VEEDIYLLRQIDSI